MRAIVRSALGAFTLATAFAAHAAAPPAEPPAPPLKIAPVAFSERLLPNGLQVIGVPNHASPTVSVQVWYHVGAKDDPPGRSGFAHLFEHLMFKSTAHLASEQFDRLTEDVGGANNAFTSNDVTGYTDLVPSNHLEVLLWAEAERMSSLNVVQASFVSERAVVEEEYRQRILASPYGRFANAIPQAAYQLHPYKRPSIGSIDDLEAATLADVVAFHATYYRPDNATLVVAGDFEPKQLDAWVDRYFARVPRPAEPLPRVASAEPAWTSDRSVTVTGPQVPLPAVALVWLAPPLTDRDAPALQIAAALLSAGESARLNESLVYRQRIAGQAGFDADLRTGPGLLIATAIAASGKAPDAVARSLLAEVTRLAQQPPAAAELAKVKTQLLTGALLSRQTPEGLASAVAEAAVLQGGADHVNTDLVALQAVTAADVQRVMKRWVASAHKLTLRYVQGDTPATPKTEGAPR
ncbi:MAG TPA: pitrilysin family protein [Burkholderiaceae bacterium]|nr:pitrilysin family protein [Burkholderiaceae bacterium]